MLGSGKEFVITKAQTYGPGHGGVIALICALSRYMELVHLQVSLTFLHHVGVPFIKIGSGDVINPNGVSSGWHLAIVSDRTCKGKDLGLCDLKKLEH